MAQVINGIWCSPTFAHSLIPGDLVHMPGVGHARVTGVWQEGGRARLRLTNQRGTGDILVGWNLPILRALGCQTGGLQ